jgi:hypothetical protein
MRGIRLDRTFDVVLLYDSINYMKTEEELRSAFVTAHEHLNPDGIAITLVEETPETFRQNKTKVNHRRKDNIELTYIEHWYDPDPSDTTYETTFVYLIRNNRKLTVETDMHICGIFSLDTWERLLKDIGFKSKRDTFRHSTFAPGEEFPILIGYR